MANHKSAAKRARQTIKKTAVNKQRTSTVRTFETKLRKAIAAKDVKAIPVLLKEYTAKVSKAAAKGLFKKETASRKIARISKQVSSLLKG